ncbi:MAG: endonuclease MutS2 [Chloroflexota bacterium]
MIIGQSWAASRHAGSWYTARAVDAKSIVTLELPKILDRLAGFAAFSASASLARQLTPTADLDEAVRRQRETSEARNLLSIHSDLTIGGARDIRSLVMRAARGAALEPLELLEVQATLIAARNLRRTFDKLADTHPCLWQIAEGLQPCPGLVEAISRTVDEAGEVLDGASEALARIRSELRRGRERLTTKLQRLIADPKIVPLLQEAIITQREGRYVVPLRAEFKGRLKAIVHDQSSSGATLFVEPLTVVDLNNQLRELELAERDEVRRILAEVSRQIGAQAAEVVQTVEAIAALDLVLAKARYADALRANEPVLRSLRSHRPAHPGATLRLLAARHPLLDPDAVVPINVALDDETYALVITGPNTGGKTVTLKTVGLLALMAQCGLHIPAASGSELSVFDAVYADIGDEQSIEQSLSTFSSHITNTIRILEQATPRSLVLLDELGAGTDPQEGSALARAILQAFLQRPVTLLVATHYPELKAYAHVTPGVRNASVEFDLETLRPTYHLTIGLPGRSNALAIAERLGLSLAIIVAARSMLSLADLTAESLLDEIHRQRDAARQASREAEAARAAAQALEAELSRRLDAIEDERRAVLEAAREQAAADVEAVGEEVRALRRRLAAAARPMEELDELRAAVEALEQRLEAPLAREVGGQVEAFRLGERVRLQRLGTEGVITALDAGQAEVQIGRLRVRAGLDELTAAGGEASAGRGKRRRMPEREPAEPAATAVQTTPPPLDIDLRGRLAEEALEELDRKLDAAYLAGMPFVRVIHGRGTGRLRQVIRQALRSNPYVASFEPGVEGEGGEGVTVVRLRRD